MRVGWPLIPLGVPLCTGAEQPASECRGLQSSGPLRLADSRGWVEVCRTNSCICWMRTPWGVCVVGRAWQGGIMLRAVNWRAVFAGIVLVLVAIAVGFFSTMRIFRRSKPGDRKVDQSLTADIASHPFNLLAYSHQAALLLGDTEIKLTPRHLEALRALYVAAVCGT